MYMYGACMYPCSTLYMQYMYTVHAVATADVFPCAAGGCAGGSMSVFQLDDACAESVSASEGEEEEDTAAML